MQVCKGERVKLLIEKANFILYICYKFSSYCVLYFMNYFNELCLHRKIETILFN